MKLYQLNIDGFSAVEEMLRNEIYATWQELGQPVGYSDYEESEYWLNEEVASKAIENWLNSWGVKQRRVMPPQLPGYDEWATGRLHWKHSICMYGLCFRLIDEWPKAWEFVGFRWEYVQKRTAQLEIVQRDSSLLSLDEQWNDDNQGE